MKRSRDLVVMGKKYYFAAKQKNKSFECTKAFNVNKSNELLNKVINVYNSNNNEVGKACFQ